MFASIQSINRAVEDLKDVHPFFGISFLAFKQVGLPIGTTKVCNASRAMNYILETYYRVTQEYEGFFQPLKSTETWVSKRYGSTALQRINKDTFSDALLHPSKTEWGWDSDYVRKLAQHLDGRKIVASSLALFLFRNFNWDAQTTYAEISDQFFEAFDISEAEISELFITPNRSGSKPELSEVRITDNELFNTFGYPPGVHRNSGSTLVSFTFNEVGPAKNFTYTPSKRLNIITGDNGLGKTFILDATWWALSSFWPGFPLWPKAGTNPKSGTGRLSYELEIGAKKLEKTATFYLGSHDWLVDRSASEETGVMIYSRHDGSFTLWDTARMSPSKKIGDTRMLSFTRHEIWNGLRLGVNENEKWISNGLLRDWVSWQQGGERTAKTYDAFLKSLQALSPSDRENLVPGRLVRLPGSAIEYPTLKMPYGDVPIIHTSAGVQRILAIAYSLVWAWSEHLANSEISRREPQQTLVLLIDEAEAHLHPKWQRLIIPALIKVVEILSESVNTQIHVATHSPMVLASAETVFDESKDGLHHLSLQGSRVDLEKMKFVRRGTSDSWLMSEAFGLSQPRSKKSEDLIARANSLLLDRGVNLKRIESLDRELRGNLAPDDEFWPRWRYFVLKSRGEIDD